MSTKLFRSTNSTDSMAFCRSVFSKISSSQAKKALNFRRYVLLEPEAEESGSSVAHSFSGFSINSAIGLLESHVEVLNRV